MRVNNNPFFNGETLGLHASLNRLIVARLPEGDFPSQWQGMSGMQLLSSQSIIDQMAAYPEVIPPSDWTTLHYPEYLDSLLVTGSKVQQSLAKEIFSSYGKAIACVIRTAVEGHSDNRAVRADWDEECWQFWASRDSIYLGGGLVSGHSADNILSSLRVSLHKNSPPVSITAHPRLLPLLGAARSLPVQDGLAAVFDMGQTAIKRGYVEIKQSKIVRLTLLPLWPVDRDYTVYDVHARADARAVRENVYNCIRETIQITESAAEVQAAGFSVANYISGGIMADRGLYRNLNEEGFDFRANLGRHTGFKGPVRIFHDGTASGLVMAEHPECALLVLGSAIGVGFPVIPPALELDRDTIQLDHLSPQ